MSGTGPLFTGFDALGLDAMRALEREQENLVLSPASLAMAVAMTWAGARGETADEIQRALGLPSSREEALRTAAGLASALGRERKLEVHLANRLFTARGRGLSSGFVETCSAVFRAGCEEIDFGSDPEAARAVINAWTARATKDRITEVLPAGSIDRETRLVIDAAVYLNAKWAEPFDAGSTRPGAFIGPGGQRSVAKMIGTKYLAASSVSPGLRALELPYENDEASLLVLVPDDADAFRALGATLTPDRAREIAGGLQPGELLVHMPKVDEGGAGPLALSPALRRLGIVSAFDRERADFRLIADPPNPADRLCLAEAFHAATMRIDEAGTEAAAATALVFAPLGGPPSAPAVFDVDRPFYYLVREHASGAVLFAGRVVDLPSAR